MVKKILAFLSVPALLLLCFKGTSFAAGEVAGEDGSLPDLLRPIWDAATGGHWWLSASLALVAAVTLFKKYAPGKLGAWAHTNAGASVLVLVGSFGGALATGLLTSGTDAISMALVMPALKVAFGAAGGYALVKNLVVDPLVKSEWYQNKAPTWLKGAMGIVTWMFSKSSVAKDAVKAGDAAVLDKPAAGADGVVDQPKDL